MGKQRFGSRHGARIGRPTDRPTNTVWPVASSTKGFLQSYQHQVMTSLSPREIRPGNEFVSPAYTKPKVGPTFSVALRREKILRS